MIFEENEQEAIQMPKTLQCKRRSRNKFNGSPAIFFSSY